MHKVKTILFLAVMANVCGIAHAAHSAYECRQQVGQSHTVVTVYDAHSQRKIWRRTFRGVQSVCWSPDHQALALAVQNFDNNHQFALLTWKPGEPARLFSQNNLFQDNDGVMDALWSPDNSKLLFRVWVSGGLDMNQGQLWCLEPDTRKIYSGPFSVRRMQWISSNMVRYWQIDSKVPWIRDGRPSDHYYTVPSIKKHFAIWHIAHNVER